MPSITKKEYEALLNEKYGVDRTRWGNESSHARGAKSRPYGTYLRRQDLDKFNVEYEHYVLTGDFYC